MNMFYNKPQININIQYIFIENFNLHLLVPKKKKNKNIISIFSSFFFGSGTVFIVLAVNAISPILM